MPRREISIEDLLAMTGGLENLSLVLEDIPSEKFQRADNLSERLWRSRGAQ